jgi:hypothetical protein
MKILQNPISDSHLSAMFFDGVVATKGDYSLVTYQDGELVYDDKLYIGKEIIGLSDVINDVDIEDEVTVDIHVDKFFAIKYNDVILEEYIYNDFDEAIEEFKNFLNKI